MDKKIMKNSIMAGLIFGAILSIIFAIFFFGVCKSEARMDCLIFTVLPVFPGLLLDKLVGNSLNVYVRLVVSFIVWSILGGLVAMVFFKHKGRSLKKK